MSVLAAQKIPWDNMPARGRTVLRYALDVELGDPALYEIDPGGQKWYIWSDSHISIEDIADFATLFTGSPSRTYTLPVGIDSSVASVKRAAVAQLKSDNAGFVASNRVWPVPGLEDEDDPYAFVLAAQNAPATLKAGASVPNGLTVVDSE